MASKKLQEMPEEELQFEDIEDIAEQSGSMSTDAEADVEAAMNALEEDTELTDNDELGYSEGEPSTVEQMAEDGQSTMEIDGETVEVSKGAAKRFAMFDENGDGLFSTDEVDAIKDQIKKNNQTVGLKDNSDGPIRIERDDGSGERLDCWTDDELKAIKKEGRDPEIKLGEDGEDGTITRVNSKTNHYSGPLGEFDYNTNYYAIAYKTVYDEIGGESVSTEIPILRFVGDKHDAMWSGYLNNNKDSNHGHGFDIPDGVKSLDYTFENIEDFKYGLAVPDSVESMHCTYKGCTALTDFVMWQTQGEGWFKGKGGVNKLPDSVKDVSYCFEDCTNLKEGFTDIGSESQLENMDGYAKNCKNLETILDVSTAKFLPVSAQTDAYDGINVKMLKSIGAGENKIEINQDEDGVEVDEQTTGEGEDAQVNKVIKVNDKYAGISMYANEGSVYQPGKNETDPYSVDEKEHLNYVKAIQDYRANDRMYLADPTSVANATNNMATTATYIDENGQTIHTEDASDKNAEGSSTSSSSSGLLGGLLGGDTGQLVQRLGFGFLEYSVLKKFVKNPLVALGITAGGQLLGVLPGTVSGLGKTISSIGSMFGEDSTIGGMLTKVGDKLSGFGSDGTDGNNTITKEEASEMNIITDAQQASEAQNNTMKDSAMSKLNDNMTKRGTYSAEYGSFQEAAEVQEGYGVFNNVKMASEDSMSALSVAILEKKQADGGELSDESKAEIAKTSKQILTSWSKYGEAAEDSLRETYGGNPEEQAKGEAGLGKMMRAAVQPDLEIIKDLDEKYGFFSESDKQELDNLSFAGLEGVTYSTYESGMNLAPDDVYCDKYDKNGNLKSGYFEDYVPDTYNIDEFESKAAQKHDLNTRTENYVSGFGDGTAIAEKESGGKTEVSDELDIDLDSDDDDELAAASVAAVEAEDKAKEVEETTVKTNKPQTQQTTVITPVTGVQDEDEDEFEM